MDWNLACTFLTDIFLGVYSMTIWNSQKQILQKLSPPTCNDGILTFYLYKFTKVGIHFYVIQIKHKFQRHTPTPYRLAVPTFRQSFRHWILLLPKTINIIVTFQSYFQKFYALLHKYTTLPSRGYSQSALNPERFNKLNWIGNSYNGKPENISISEWDLPHTIHPSIPMSVNLSIRHYRSQCQSCHIKFAVFHPSHQMLHIC